VARTILQDLKVLSAGHDLGRDADGKPLPVQVVNLLVTPEQAEVLSLASTEAKVQLVLRNPLDREVAKTDGTTTASILRIGSAPTPAPPPPPAVTRVAPAEIVRPAPAAPVRKPITVELVNGSKKEAITVGYTSVPAGEGISQ
jgi:pilus assembly protein CpaB